MRIIKYFEGWKIEPSTDEEEKALQFIISAFQKAYCNVNSKGVEKATDSQFLDLAQSMETSA